jgi:hypothetical protein
MAMSPYVRQIRSKIGLTAWQPTGPHDEEFRFDLHVLDTMLVGILGYKGPFVDVTDPSGVRMRTVTYI